MPKYFGWVSYCINKNLNIKLFLGGNDDGVALRCFWNNHYEEQAVKLWLELTQIEGIILDIGAHTGIYSLIANCSINKGAVLSFEPYYMNFARLNLNLRANSITRVVVAHRLSAIRNCDHMIVINKGRIESEGSFEHCLENSEYLQSVIKNIGAN